MAITRQASRMIKDARDIPPAQILHAFAEKENALQSFPPRVRFASQSLVLAESEAHSHFIWPVPAGMRSPSSQGRVPPALGDC